MTDMLMMLNISCEVSIRTDGNKRSSCGGVKEMNA